MGMFAKAQAIAPAAATKAKGVQKVEREIVDLKRLAEIDALMKALEGMKATYQASVNAEALDYFIDVSGGRRPESFRGIDGDASASIELRKRSTASKLTDEEQILLAARGIVGETVVTTTKLFAINPKYAGDEALLGKVEKALSKIAGLPEDFIVVQEEVSKVVVADKTVDEVFAAIHLDISKTTTAADRQAAIIASRALVSTVCTQAIKPKLATTDVETLLVDIAAYVAADKAAEDEEIA